MKTRAMHNGVGSLAFTKKMSTTLQSNLPTDVKLFKYKLLFYRTEKTYLTEVSI